MKHQNHPSAVIEPTATIGKGTKIWHFSHIMKNSRIGENCSIGQNVVVSPNVVIGNQVKIQNNVSVYEGVTCEDFVFLGPSMVFTNVINPRSEVSRRDEFLKTTIRRGVSIGANATIVCGVEIGEYAFIAAGATVTKNVPAYAQMIGSPCKQTAWMSRSGHKLRFDIHGVAICPQTKEKYIYNRNLKIIELVK